jgi:DNA repair protein RecO (recombination protein O)
MLRLFPEQEANERAFTALTRFLDCLDGLPPLETSRPALDPLALSFQLKLLWLSGYLPHLDACVECGLVEELVGYLPSAGGAVCRDCGPGTISLSPEGLRGIRTLVATPLADAHDAALTPRAAREALAVVTANYEHHGGFRLRTLSA